MRPGLFRSCRPLLALVVERDKATSVQVGRFSEVQGPTPALSAHGGARE